MNITTFSDPLSLLRYPVVDPDGTEVGDIAGVYLDRGTGEPEWAALWLPAGPVTVVPLADADLYEDSVAIPFSRDQVEGAPYQREELARELSEDEETELYHYYHEGGSTLAAARRAATEVAETAKMQTQRVASAAKGQGREVAQSAVGQASEAKQEAARVAQATAGQAQGLLEGIRRFARRRPAVFLLGTAVAGIAAGRLVRHALTRRAGAPEEEQEEPTRPTAPSTGGATRRRATTPGGR